VQLWDDVTSKASLEVVKHSDDVKRLRFTPDGRKLILGGWG